MTAPGNQNCPRCGARLPASPTAGSGLLCPACLLSGALEHSSDATRTIAEGPDDGRPGLPPEAQAFPCDWGGYRLTGKLGSGGMGTVFEAEELATGRRVALKMLGHQLDTPEMRQRFLREGRLAARVSHPNSLYVFGSEEIEGHPVITMEVAAGGTLRDRLKARGPLPVAEAVDAILDVIAGLESAGAQGVLHRDVKPSNCFITPDGHVKVGDYGLSVSTLTPTDSFVTAHGKIMGTPAYAAPEQLRGDTLDLRADIYSVGATLYTLLTNRAPFEGDNAVQVVANAVNQPPRPLVELRKDLPPGLAQVVNRCLAKEPEGRFADYRSLRHALLPFSSQEPEPASLTVRAAAGWIDYLIAFLVPYVVLMLALGAEKFHFQPFFERTLFSARYYLAFLAFGFLYFAFAEGVWGGGFGKRLKGLRVIRPDGRLPGFGRGLLRVVVPLVSIEGLRVPFLLATISPSSTGEITSSQAWLYTIASNVFPWVAVLLTLGARRDNGFATVWDRLTGTRVVFAPKGLQRPLPTPTAQAAPAGGADGLEGLGHYVVRRRIQPGEWLLAEDPVLRREVWLVRRGDTGPSDARRHVARPGRPRWLQKVETSGGVWDAFEAPNGTPFLSLVADGKRLPWSKLRHWLHDLAAELWEAGNDGTLPAEVGLDQIWITAGGQAMLLDCSWPGAGDLTQRIPVADITGQQSFLSQVAEFVESAGVPLHARPVLTNLAGGRFEKLSYLTGTLRGLLDRPAEVSRGIRAGAMFMLPFYIWILVFLGYSRDEAGPRGLGFSSEFELLVGTLLAILAGAAVIQLLELPFRTTFSQAIFRLAIVDSRGRLAGLATLLRRWAIIWLPLFVPMALMLTLVQPVHPIANGVMMVLLLGLWVGLAVQTALKNPHRGWADRLAGTWVVRR
jgi:uncharacterized RDD family membrane protein YckC